MPTDRSTNPTVITYAVQDLFKGKSPAAAAKHTVKKLSGTENMFLGPGVSTIDPKALEAALWEHLADFVIAGFPKMKPGKEDYALDGTIFHFSQKPAIRERLYAEVVKRLGRDPFVPSAPIGFAGFGWAR